MLWAAPGPGAAVARAENAERAAAGSTGDGAGARLIALPHPVQKLAVSGTGLPQLVQNMLSLLGVMMHVHRLDTDASRPGHARQTHVGAAEESASQALELHVHVDR